MVAICKSIAEDSRFQSFITGVILLAAIIVGIETYDHMVVQHGPLLHALNKIVLWIFVGEIAIKMVAEGRRPWRFFQDSWNVFDFVIVAAAFLPFAAQYATVLRLLRLLRVLRLLRAVPKLQMLVGALLKSIPSMGYVSLLLGLLFYVYAAAAVFLWGGNDPVHFGNLQVSLLSLFRAVTLEDWTDLMYIQMYGCAGYGYDGMMDQCTASSASPLGGALFFVSFVLLGTMIILNLFIGVILNGMDEAQAETDREAEANRIATGQAPPLPEQLRDLQTQLAEMQGALSKMELAAVRISERPPALDRRDSPFVDPMPAE